MILFRKLPQDIQILLQACVVGKQHIFIRVAICIKRKIHPVEGVEQLGLDHGQVGEVIAPVKPENSAPPRLVPGREPVPLQDLLPEIGMDGLAVYDGTDQIVYLGALIPVLQVDLVLPEKQESDPLRQIGIAAYFIGISRDADHGCRFLMVADRQVDAPADAPGMVVLSNDGDLAAFRRVKPRLMKTADPQGIRTGQDPAGRIDEIDIVIADRFESIHDLRGERRLDLCGHPVFLSWGLYARKSSCGLQDMQAIDWKIYST